MFKKIISGSMRVIISSASAGYCTRLFFAGRKTQRLRFYHGTVNFLIFYYIPELEFRVLYHLNALKIAWLIIIKVHKNLY